MVATISEQPDIEIVGEVQDDANWRARWKRRDRISDRCIGEGSNRLPQVCHSFFRITRK